MNPLIHLIALPFVILAIWLVAAAARRRARPQLTALEQAKTAGEPFSSDVKAYLGVVVPHSRVQSFAYGVLHIRPGSLSWESRFGHRQVDLSAAVLISEDPGDRNLDMVAQYTMTLRQGDQIIELKVRRPRVPVVKAGLGQAAR